MKDVTVSGLFLVQHRLPGSVRGSDQWMSRLLTELVSRRALKVAMYG